MSQMQLLMLVLDREVEHWEQGDVVEGAVEKSCFG